MAFESHLATLATERTEASASIPEAQRPVLETSTRDANNRVVSYAGNVSLGGLPRVLTRHQPGGSGLTAASLPGAYQAYKGRKGRPISFVASKRAAVNARTGSVHPMIVNGCLQEV